ncbi:MAG: hypothetical protein A2Z19_06595 [Deltaproteobacteria bacterium RBG_16_54_18]|nr:MAG: hypothetical protein A2Z19_06595 [Deltaproteobacteria bacterium RBG_16_54_18]
MMSFYLFNINSAAFQLIPTASSPRSLNTFGSVCAQVQWFDKRMLLQNKKGVPEGTPFSHDTD